MQLLQRATFGLVGSTHDGGGYQPPRTSPHPPTHTKPHTSQVWHDTHERIRDLHPAPLTPVLHPRSRGGGGVARYAGTPHARFASEKQATPATSVASAANAAVAAAVAAAIAAAASGSNNSSSGSSTCSSDIRIKH